MRRERQVIIKKWISSSVFSSLILSFSFLSIYFLVKPLAQHLFVCKEKKRERKLVYLFFCLCWWGCWKGRYDRWLLLLLLGSCFQLESSGCGWQIIRPFPPFIIFFFKETKTKQTPPLHSTPLHKKKETNYPRQNNMFIVHRKVL